MGIGSRAPHQRPTLPGFPATSRSGPKLSLARSGDRQVKRCVFQGVDVKTFRHPRLSQEKPLSCCRRAELGNAMRCKSMFALAVSHRIAVLNTT